MTHCSDIDTLVSLSELLGDRTLVELRHVLECDECRQQLQTLTTLRAGLGHVVQPEPAFTDAMLGVLPDGGRFPNAGAFLEKWVALVASPVLAALTVLLLLVQAAGAAGMPLGLHMPVMASLAGVSVAVWNRFGADMHVMRRFFVATVLGLLFGAGGTSLTAQSLTQYVLENATVIDGTGRPPIKGASVLISGDRIVRVAQGTIDVPPEVQRIDVSGQYLIPGLMDMHIHLQGGRGRGGAGADAEAGIRALHGFLYSGITTVFDAGNNPDYILDLRAQERAGEITSPRIFATGGLVTTPGGHGGGPGATLVDRWPEDMAELDEHIAREPDMVKLTFDEHGWGTRPLIPLLDPELMAEVGRYFNEHGIRTTVHISHEFRARQAIEAGINTLAHPIIQGPISEGFAQLMASTQTPMVSTLTIGEGYSRLVEHPEFLDTPIYRDVYEPELIERLKTSVRDQYAARTWTTWMKVMTPVAQENLRLIVEAGGVIVLGSDQSSGPASHRELELMVAGGISPLEAIRIATLNAAIFLGKERDLGSIEPGKLADLVLLDADPLENISNTQRILRVIKGGRLVDRELLDLPANRR